MDPVHSSNYGVKNTERMQVDSSQETTKLEFETNAYEVGIAPVNRKSKEGNPVQPSNNSVSRKRTETTQTKQTDLDKETKQLESQKSDESILKEEVDGMSTKGDHVQASSNSVSEKRDETTQVKQADTDEITIELLETQESAEIELKGKGVDNVQPSNKSISKKGEGTSSGTKQAYDPNVKTKNSESQKSDQSILESEENKRTEGITVDNVGFKPLIIKAVQECNWIHLLDLVDRTPGALTETVSEYGDTIFHIINISSAPTWLITELAYKISAKKLQSLRGENGWSVIFHAAFHGNRKAVQVYVGRSPDFPNKRNEKGYLPIHIAAECDHKEIIQYLLSKTVERLDDDKGVELIKNLISSGHYDMALDLWERYPKFALENNSHRGSILKELAGKPLAFESGSRLGFSGRLIYDWIPLEAEYFEGSSFGALPRKIWHVLMLLVPHIKNIRDVKLTHIQTLQIVRILCHGNGVTWNRTAAFETFLLPFLEAAKLGICEIVNEILNAYFYAQNLRYENGHGLLHMAILHRQENILKIVKERNVCLSQWKAVDTDGNANILHLAGRLAQSAASSQHFSAALRMQKELEWFKAVKSYVHPSLREQRNKNNKTPSEVFIEEHKELLKEGEKWMKETSTSCSVVAALIITVVFTAAFNVPGGHNDDRIPIFLHETAFIVFVISDVLAFFSSSASVLMFISIIASRYSEDDFLVSLPMKLFIQLIALFFSTACMMVAFGATLHTFLSHLRNWAIIPISLLAYFPMTLFVFSLFPLLADIFFSIYRPIIQDVRMTIAATKVLPLVNKLV